MKEVVVTVRTDTGGTYDVVTGPGVLGRLPEIVRSGGYPRVFVVADAAVADVHLPPLLAALPCPASWHAVSGGEAAKSISSAETLWTVLREAGVGRDGLVVNLGGGVVTDLGGFAAACYMRGVDFVQAPTTLLAQVDASVGGKTGVNVGGVKNLVGAFRQPAAVLADTDTLATLPPREVKAGAAEALKHGVIKDDDYFRLVAGVPARGYDTESLAAVVEGSVKVKAAVVAADPFEAGERKLLNFGHTVGHALEALSHRRGTPVLHGEAVAAGMIAEARIAEAAGVAAAGTTDVIRSALDDFGLPAAPPFATTYDELLPYLLADKKNRAGEIRWVLPERIGAARYDVTVPEGLVKHALAGWTKGAPGRGVR